MKKAFKPQHLPDELYEAIYMPITLISDPIKVPEKKQKKIDNLVAQYINEDKAYKNLDQYLSILYYYMSFRGADLDALTDLYGKLKSGVVKYEKLIKKIEKLAKDTELCSYLNIDRKQLMRKRDSIHYSIYLYKSLGKKGHKKIFYPTLAVIWSILQSLDLNKKKQVEFIYQFCILVEYPGFFDTTKKAPTSSDSTRTGQVDNIENWYDEAERFFIKF